MELVGLVEISGQCSVVSGQWSVGLVEISG